MAFLARQPLEPDEWRVLCAAWRSAGVPLPALLDGGPQAMPPAERAAAGKILRSFEASRAFERATRCALAAIRGRRLAQDGAKCPT